MKLSDEAWATFQSYRAKSASLYASMRPEEERIVDDITSAAILGMISGIVDRLTPEQKEDFYTEVAKVELDIQQRMKKEQH